MQPNYTNGAFALVFKQDGSFLLTNTHRQTGDSWSIPGGVVEPGEAVEQGAEREVLEETGITCKVIELLHVISVTITKDLELSFHLAEYVSGEIAIDPKEIEAAQWFFETDLKKLDFEYENTLDIIYQALKIRAKA